MDNKDELEKKSEKTEDSKYVEHKIENIIAARELEEKRRQADLEKKIKEDLDFRRDYYMSELERAYDRVPTEAYFKAEYEEITDKYNSLIDRMETLESEEELKACLDEFENYRRKKFDSKKVYNILLILFLLVIVGIVIATIIGVNNL